MKQPRQWRKVRTCRPPVEDSRVLPWHDCLCISISKFCKTEESFLRHQLNTGSSAYQEPAWELPVPPLGVWIINRTDTRACCPVELLADHHLIKLPLVVCSLNQYIPVQGLNEEISNDACLSTACSANISVWSFDLQCQWITHIKFLHWSWPDLFVLLSNWQKREALCSHWSLTRGPPLLYRTLTQLSSKCFIMWPWNAVKKWTSKHAERSHSELTLGKVCP